MNWFQNLKISSKLLISFSLVALIAIIVAVIGYRGIANADASMKKLYNENFLAYENLDAMKVAVQAVRGDIRVIMLAPTIEGKNKFLKTMRENTKKADAAIQSYLSYNLSPDSKKYLEEFKTNWQAYGEERDKAIPYVLDSNNDEANVILDGKAREYLNKLRPALDSLTAVNQREIDDLMSANQDDSKAATTTLMLFSIIGVVIAILLGVVISRKIGKSLNRLTLTADKLAEGNINVNVEVDSKDEIGKLEQSFELMVENIKVQAKHAENIADGDLTIEVKPKSDADVLSKSMIKMVSSVRSLIDETITLSSEAVNGNLQARGNEEKFKGSYKEIISGVNETLNSVIEPINESGKVIEKIAQGNLTVRMTGEYKGDFAIIKDSVNQLADSFNMAITEVAKAAHAAASAANEISSSTEEMSAGVQEQGSQTTEVATAVGEMTKTILETSKNSSSASEAAKNAGAIASEGGKVVDETIEGMNRIAEVVNKSAATVIALGKRSDEIGEIIQVIEDIADQTNLLALNAAIEAARAGEQGRGFAVVADEVRKLAERTTKATKEIASMIKHIQAETGGAVKSMQEGTSEVEKGKHLADKAGKSLKEIINGAQNVVDISVQVAAASEEQSSAAEEISKNIEGINNVMQETALGVQQIASASEDLSKLTVNLQELISRFKTDESRINIFRPARKPEEVHY